jgi:NADPH:quinone reductase-like Zn-dependent oxidoreductase
MPTATLPDPSRSSDVVARSIAARVHAYGGPEALAVDAVPVPTAGEGQVLVRIRAAGVNGIDWKVRDGLLEDAFPLPLPVTLGVELAGQVAGVGPGVTGLAEGDRVMGPLLGFGAYADFAAVDAAVLCRTPAALGDVEAAAVPVAALTAWQALDAAERALGDGVRGAGRTVLVHGAAGGVGGFAVQLAKARGLTVLATASAASRDHVAGLGADAVIDYRAERFEERVAAGGGQVDVVLDFVGGDTLTRSWAVLAPGGALVSTAAPDAAGRVPEPSRRSGVTAVGLMMRPDAARLAELAGAVAAGALRSTVAEVVGLAGLPAALERNKTGHAPGKTVLDLTR